MKTDQPTHNRIAAVMAHAARYGFGGAAKLARDAGVSKSAACRLMRGETSPSFALVSRITSALERGLGIRLDPRELVSETGDWPTTFVCELCGCEGCVPAAAYGEDDEVRPECRLVAPGRWTGDAFEFARPGKEER